MLYFRFHSLIAILVTLVCTYSPAIAEQVKRDWGKVSTEEWAISAPESFLEAPAIVIFDDGILEVPKPYEGNRTTLKRHVRTKIISKVGAEAAMSIEIPVYELEKFMSFEGHTLTPDGKKHKIEKSAILKKKVGKKLEIVTFTFPAVEDGCIVEYRYQLRSDNFGFLQPWYFQGATYILESRFESILHGGLNYTAVYHNIPDELRTPVRQEYFRSSGTLASFTWSLKNLFPVEQEPYMAAASNYRASIFLQLSTYQDAYNNISYIEDWPSLASMMERHMVEPALRDDKGVEDAASELSGGLTAQDEIAEALFDFVRTEILTVEDDGAYELATTSVENVLRDRRGSGISKNLLLIALYRSAGLKANAILIGTRAHSAFNPAVFNVDQFDYLLCMVTTDKGKYVLDAADRWVPFPYLPASALVDGGLLLDGESSQPVSIKAPSRKSIFASATRMELTEDGSAVCTSHITISGYLMSHYKKLLDTRPNSEEARDALLDDESVGFELLDYQLNEFQGEDSVSIDLVFQLPEYCELIDDNFIGSPTLFSLKTNPFKKERRFFPVDFGYSFSVSETLDLTVKSPLHFKKIPENLSLSISGLGFSRNSLQAGDQIRMMSQTIVNKSIFLPAEYKSLRDSFEKIANASGDQFIVGP